MTLRIRNQPVIFGRSLETKSPFQGHGSGSIGKRELREHRAPQTVGLWAGGRCRLLAHRRSEGIRPGQGEAPFRSSLAGLGTGSSLSTGNPLSCYGISLGFFPQCFAGVLSEHSPRTGPGWRCEPGLPVLPRVRPAGTRASTFVSGHGCWVPHGCEGKKEPGIIWCSISSLFISSLFISQAVGREWFKYFTSLWTWALTL